LPPAGSRLLCRSPSLRVVRRRKPRLTTPHWSYHSWTGYPACDADRGLLAADTRDDWAVLADRQDVAGEDGTSHALERQLANGFGLDQLLQDLLRSRAEEDLPGLRLAGKAGGEDGDVADCAVVVASIEADPPEGRVAHGNPHAEAQLIAEIAPRGGQVGESIAHLHGHPDAAFDVVALLDRVVEEDHHAIAGEVLQRSLVLRDGLAHHAVVLAQQRHQLFRI